MCIPPYHFRTTSLVLHVYIVVVWYIVCSGSICAVRVLVSSRRVVSGLDKFRAIERAGDDNALSSSTTISIAYVGGRPVAACMLFVECDDITCYVFVRKRFRRQRIGTTLYKAAIEQYSFLFHGWGSATQEVAVYKGVDKSDKFWQSIGLTPRY